MRETFSVNIFIPLFSSKQGSYVAFCQRGEKRVSGVSIPIQSSQVCLALLSTQILDILGTLIKKRGQSYSIKLPTLNRHHEEECKSQADILIPLAQNRFLSHHKKLLSKLEIIVLQNQFCRALQNVMFDCDVNRYEDTQCGSITISLMSSLNFISDIIIRKEKWRKGHSTEKSKAH